MYLPGEAGRAEDGDGRVQGGGGGRGARSGRDERRGRREDGGGGEAGVGFHGETATANIMQVGQIQKSKPLAQKMMTVQHIRSDVSSSSVTSLRTSTAKISTLFGFSGRAASVR